MASSEKFVGSSALLLLSAAAFAQAGRLDGTLVNAATGEPAPNVRVTMTRSPEGPSDKGMRYGATTDAEGKFSWPAIPYGVYEPGISKRGFLLVEAPPMLWVRPGDSPSLRLKLSPEAVIRGKVLDENGDPFRNAWIEIRDERGNYAGNAAVDYRGDYRFAGKPGRYRVRAMVYYERRPPETRSDGSRETVYRSTYYPASAAAGGASWVEAKSGMEAGGIDIRLIPMPYILVSGVVTGIPPTVGDVQVQFTPDGETQPLQSQVKNGRFSTWLLPPGKYSMMVACTGRDGRSYRSAIDDITIGDKGVGNLALDMRPEFELTGRIQWEGSPPAPAPREQQPKPSVRLSDIGFLMFAPRRIGEIGADQTFRIPKVVLGKYRVSVEGLPQNIWVKSIQVDSREIRGHTLELRAAPQLITVRLATGGAQISGTVEDAKGPVNRVNVILVPDEAGEFDPFLSQTSNTGSFSFDNVPPGRYRLEVEGARPSDGQPFEEFDVSETDRLTRNLKIEPPMQ